MKRILFFLVFLLSIVSCDNVQETIVPGQVYLFTTTRDKGCAVFSHGIKDRWEGTYYVDEGKPFASARKVTLRLGKQPVLVDSAGNKTPITEYSEYQAPSFTRFPPTWSYRDSVYAVREIPDVSYGKANGYWTSYPNPAQLDLPTVLDLLPSAKSKLDLTMDLYLPEDGGQASRPLLVLVHGGAFVVGDKASLGFPEWGRYFAGLGYVVASVNYRMGFHLIKKSVARAGYRAVQDVNAAIVRILHDSDENNYRVDPERVFVAGTSAGGITALNTAFMREDIHIPVDARDEGSLRAVNAHIDTSFSIRAVGNMWGAVENLSILDGTETAILSIHNTGDPVVPFGKDHPFTQLLVSRLGLNKLVFPQMSGSSEITLRVGAPRAELLAYDLPGKHTLHIDKDANENERLNERFYEIQGRLRDFFAKWMLPHPVQLTQVNGSNLFRVDAANVKTISWNVEGGIIREQGSLDQARILFFPDTPTHSVTVSGEYTSGLTFYETLNCNQ